MARENRFFLLSSELAGCAPTNVGGKPAVAHFSDLVDRLEALCGREAAGLFAEPMLPRNAVAPSAAISWYGPFEGRSVELDSVDAVARKPVAGRLTERLDALAPAFSDPQLAPLIAASLSLTSSKDIIAVGGEPLLVNWGYLPQDAAVDPAHRLDHFSRTLGRYAPKLTPLMAQALGVDASSASPTPESPSPPANPAPSAPLASPPAPKTPLPPTPKFPPGDPNGTTPAGWRAPLIATCVAAAVLFILLLPGVLVYPNFGEQAASEEFEAQRLRASNLSLDAQLKALQKANNEGVCRADKMAPVPDLGPTDPSKPPPQMELLPHPPDKAALPTRPGETPQASTIAQLLEKATVYVFVVDRGDKASSGSGFFIGNGKIVTNRHVIEDALDEQFIFVASKAIGGVRRARVVAKTPPRRENVGPQPDFAVLEIARAASADSLKLGSTPPKLSTAYIAGYPGFLVRQDVDNDKFISELKEALEHGEGDDQLAARHFNVPSVDLRYGRINNVMSSGAIEMPIVVHDMQVAHGNSGGPLVDACGRVGGVNTLFFADENQVGNVALDVTGLRKFLTENRIAFTADDSPCGGPTADARPVPPPTAPPPTPPQK